MKLDADAYDAGFPALCREPDDFSVRDIRDVWHICRPPGGDLVGTLCGDRGPRIIKAPGEALRDGGVIRVTCPECRRLQEAQR